LGGRSIPQGHSPADILAKLYLSPVDSALQDFGHKHFRFVDDFRFFCRNLREAKRALIDLTKLLRARGLVLNSSKSQILDVERAQQIIDGRIPVIEGVRRDIVEKITAQLGAEYVDRAQAESILGKPVEEISVDLIENTMDIYFLKGAGFSPTLFHFLLNRLAAGKNRFAVEYCLTLLTIHPEETDAILDYVGEVCEFSEIDEQIAAFLESPDAALYPYQIYLVLDWLSDLNIQFSDRLFGIIRRLAFEPGCAPYVRSVCIKLLGDFGKNSDLLGLETFYSNARNAPEQADIICALRRMEVIRRNSFLGRIQNDNEWTRRAVAYVKSLV
jgi:Reverse transcriptase (RNA-dependent DNA polymerase)